MVEEAFTKYHGVDWIGMVLAAVSLFCLAKSKRYGFVLGIMSNIAWLVFAFMAESVANVISSLVYMGMNIYGMYQWTRTPPHQCPQQ